MEENKINKINELAKKILDANNYNEKIDVLRILFKKYIKKHKKYDKILCRDQSHKEFFREYFKESKRSQLHWSKFYDMSH